MPTVCLIAEDQHEREALAELFLARGWQVQDFAGLDGFLNAPAPVRPACVVVDLPPGGVGVVRRLRSSPRPLPIVALCAGANVALAVRAMKDGAADFFAKPVDGARLLGATRVAMEATRARVERACEAQLNLERFNTLRPRERDVIEAVADGLGNREVAAQLGIKPRTVEVHRARAMAKLGARTLVDLVRIRLDVDHARERLQAK
jgi:two-component system, LuxR family, response regulator FixJ